MSFAELMRVIIVMHYSSLEVISRPKSRGMNRYKGTPYEGWAL